jgi:glycosyltransferase involved in cell wall biosynthesis
MGCRDITVIVCTCNRPESLSQTLQRLADADHDGLDVEVIVVENGRTTASRDAADAFSNRMATRYVLEPLPGKEHALNRGIQQEGLGEIVAFLDDDMSPDSSWWRGIHTVCERHPECDFFTGRSHIIWPTESIPGWARVYAVQCWAHSVLDYGEHEHPFLQGEWPSPNMFWIRRRVLDEGRRFDEGRTARYHTGDIDFLLRLAEDGYQGVAAPDVVVGHRVQPELLDLDAIRRRAIRLGRSLALVRLDKPRTLPQARLFRNHPLVFRALSVANLARWSASYILAYAASQRDTRIIKQLVALLGIANNYQAVFYRRQRQAAPPRELTKA